MPVRTFTCPKCNLKIEHVLFGEDDETFRVSHCFVCDVPAPRDDDRVPLVASRDGKYGIQT